MKLKAIMVLVLMINSIIAGTQNKEKCLTLTFENKSINVGVKEITEKIEVEYKYTNETDKPIIIKGVLPGCGCIEVGNIENVIVKPGESGKIKLGLKEKGSGYFKKSARVITEKEVIKLEFYGTIN